MNDRELPIINQMLCTHCGSCVAVCPEQVLAMNEGKVVFTRPQVCTYCTQCEEACPVNAIICGFSVGWADNA